MTDTSQPAPGQPREIWGRRRRASQRRRRSRHVDHSAILLNAIGGVLVVFVFVAICGWSILSADDELAETAELAAERWALAAVVDSDALDHLIGHGEVTAADRTYLETIARTANVVSFAIYDAAGRSVFNYAPGTALTLPDRLAPLEGEGTRTEILYDAGDPPVADALARVSIPLERLGADEGSIIVITDQTEALHLYSREMRVTLALTGLLTAIALLSSFGVDFLLRRKQSADEKIFTLAHQDSLTGLANRAEFQNMLEMRFQALRPAGPGFALHFLDLDGFKAVNDTLGHHAGDKLLQAVAQQLRNCERQGDVIARLGGDEFAVIQANVRSAADAEALAERLVDSVRGIRMGDGGAVGVSLSAGIALAPHHADNTEDLVKYADIALYRAKEEGRDRKVTFTSGMEEEVNARNALRRIVREATETGAIEVHYQPIYAVSDDHIASFEALARLPDPNGGSLISPSEFVPIAEAMGLMPRLGALVLQEACRAAASWEQSVAVAVNLSATQFSEDVVPTVRAALEASGLDPARLELEITESLLIANEETVIHQLDALKALGVRIVMDDFGTGYSSLSYLWKFPFDKLKVDRSFFNELGKSESVREVLRTISTMGEIMHLTVVAEGIETEDQRTFARRAGYDQLQGFLCGRPMPGADVPARLAADVAARPQG